ncbi:uncharacterized protein LOC128955552 [Oppia nitens]|uniref:uncharacterized protein LOC128955552 n=1 Tax=Oppia nitens TaxID=1686743 RepID=UPI0023DA7AD6|nr:uncharacterized protein LOC128955552 [Oppia nitens]
MFFNILIVIITILVVSYLYLTRNFKFWTSRGVPGPKPVPIFGTFYKNFFKSMQEVSIDNVKQYGKIYGDFFGTIPMLSIADPKLIKDIMIKDFNIFVDRDDLISGDQLNDRSLFNLKGNEWKNMRSIISPTFSSGKMRAMHHMMADCIHRLDQYIETKLQNKDIDEIELKKVMSNLTMDVIASCAFGTKVDTYGQQRSDFLINAQKVVNLDLRFWISFLILTISPKLFKLAGLKLTDPNVAKFFNKAIRSIVSRRKTESIKSKDYLQLILDAQNKSLDTNDDKDIGGDNSEEIYGSIGDKHAPSDKIDITDDDVLATSFLFFVAGYETTGSLMTLLLYNLAMNDDCQQKLYEEIKQFDGNYTYESISKMTYLEACIAETLGLYNPLVTVERISTKDYTLGDTGITIPKGTLVSANIQYIHHNPDYYPEPDRWNPERFMPYNRDKLVPYTYMPFGLGPRNCVGMRFALMEAKTATAYLVNKYQFVRTDNTPDKLKPLKMQFLLNCGEIKIGVKKRYMFLNILIAIIIILVVSYLYLTSNFKFWTSRGVSGPKPIPIFGTFYKYITKSRQQVCIENVKQYGKIYGDYLGKSPILTIADPKLIKDIMIKDFNIFVDRDKVITDDKLHDRSLFNLKGNEWKNMRSIITPTFSSGKIRSMNNMMTDCIHRLDQYIETKLKNKDIDEIELKKLMSSLTMDVIASCAFGTKVDTYGQQSCDFLINAQKVVKFDLRFLFSIFLLNISPKLFKLIGLQLINPNVATFFKKAIRSIVSRRKTETIKSKDYLQLILNAQNKTLDTSYDNDIGGDNSEEIYGSTGDKHAPTDKIDITDDDVLATSFLFFFAGYETTGSLMTLLLYNLTVNDDCQQKLYEEIKQFDGNYTYESISKMVYLEACIAETLRLYNPLVTVDRISTKDYSLGDTGITIPKGTVVSANIQYIHHNPEYYPEPDRWNPERFMPYNRDKLVPYTYMPFGLGPRNCVGMRFALMEAKTATAYLVNKYQFVRTDNTPDKLKPLKMQFLLNCGEIKIGVKKR